MRFTESHEWVKLNGSIATVGITAYAEKELGEIVAIELPKVGDKVKAKEEICVLESTKAAADVYAPVSGTVIAINEALKQDPTRINQHAETSGWLFQIEMTNPKEFDHLLSEKGYRALIG